MCDHFSITAEREAQGLHLTAYVFERAFVYERVITNAVSPRRVEQLPVGPYVVTPTHILWEVQAARLNRKTLLLEYGDGVFYAQCELIDPDEIEAYFQPYIDYGNALDEKAREGNKI